jgi:predicted RNA-binding Zn-ribbon protein involved in translation (DUF1610 family)
VETQDPELRERANALYWDSHESVNEIAERLDLSKGALYGLVEPLATDEPCPDCGAPLEFSNRTARDKGLVVCPSCEFEEELVLVQGARLDSLEDDHPGAFAPASGARTAVAAGLIGLAVGILLGQWSRTR